jgi:hypothetical protein
LISGLAFGARMTIPVGSKNLAAATDTLWISDDEQRKNASPSGVQMNEEMAWSQCSKLCFSPSDGGTSASFPA